jgi:hypothetical protein
MLKNVDGRLSAFQRFQIWFGRYAFIFFSVSFLVLLIFSILTAYIYYTEKSQREELLSVIDKLSNYGIFITQDNRIVALEKTKVGSVFLQGAVKNAVVNDFILSRASFLDRNGSFIRANPDRPEEFLSTLVRESDAVNNLWNYFVKDDKDSLKTFYLYTKYLYELARDGKLPDVIQPTSGVRVEYFVKEGKNTFRAKIKVPVVAAYYTASDEMRQGRGVITFEVYGEVNPVKTARYYQKNPFGIIIKRISVSYITVDSLKK